MLERILAPLQLIEGEEVTELRALARASVSKRFAGHYRGYFSRYVSGAPVQVRTPRQVDAIQLPWEAPNREAIGKWLVSLRLGEIGIAD